MPIKLEQSSALKKRQRGCLRVHLPTPSIPTGTPWLLELDSGMESLPMYFLRTVGGLALASVSQDSPQLCLFPNHRLRRRVVHCRDVSAMISLMWCFLILHFLSTVCVQLTRSLLLIQNEAQCLQGGRCDHWWLFLTLFTFSRSRIFLERFNTFLAEMGVFSSEVFFLSFSFLFQVSIVSFSVIVRKDLS